MGTQRGAEHSSVAESLGSITTMYKRALAGDSCAPDALWDHYSKRLFGLARAVLRQRGISPAHTSEDSVVNDAFARLFEAISKGRYQDVADRHELWHLLATMTRNLALNQVKRYRKAPVAIADTPESEHGDEQPTFEEVAAVSDTIESLERRIRERSKTEQQSDRIIRVMRMTLSGYTQREIASEIRQSEVTVRRNLTMIRELMRFD